MRTLTAIENALPAIEDKLALMYSELVQKSKTHLKVDKTKHNKARIFYGAMVREIACDQDLELINYYYNELQTYLTTCEDKTYTVVEVVTPVCDYNRKKYSFWIPGDVECIQTAISINVGADRSIRLPDNTLTIEATVTPENAELLWEKVSGPDVDMSGGNTNTLALSGLVEGVYYFKLTGTVDDDTISDSLRVDVLEALPTVYWDFYEEDPTDDLEELEFDYSSLILAGTTSYGLNFTAGSSGTYLVFKEPSTEPVKTLWFNTSLNNGTIPDSVFKDPVIIGEFRYYVSRIPVILDSSTYVVTFS